MILERVIDNFRGEREREREREKLSSLHTSKSYLTAPFP
jgi:hypothetical protein